MKNVVVAMATALEDFKYKYGYRKPGLFETPGAIWDASEKKLQSAFFPRKKFQFFFLPAYIDT